MFSNIASKGDACKILSDEMGRRASWSCGLDWGMDMLEKYVESDGIMLNVYCKDWQAVVDCGSAPLLRKGMITPFYVEAIKKNHRELGAYMVIAPGIVLAHARPECGAVGMGLTVLTLSEPVIFGSEMNDPVRLAFTLATPDDSSHLHLLETLTEFLMRPILVEKLMAADTVARALAILKE